MGDNILVGRDLNKPTRCEKCGDTLEYAGVGEYRCPSCRHVMYDDYGKVRNYLETHRGANQAEVSMATGVSTNTIRQLLKDDRLEVAPFSSVFMSCELCGAPIRSGRLCAECDAKRASQMAAAKPSNKNMQGYGTGKMDATGAKRFSR